MSHAKALGPAAGAAATLPVTGSSTVTVALLGALALLTGLLLMRVARPRRSAS